MPSPFQLFSWDSPFLPALVTLVDTLTDNAPERAVIVVPHNRPRRYLAELYRERAQSCGAAQMLPRVVTVQEFIALLRGQHGGQAVYTANLLDRVAVLYACVQTLAAQDSALCSRFAGMDIPRFLPWGLRLGALFEECFTQNIEAADLSYAEGEVSAVAAVLLNALGRLQKVYVQALAARGWTTAGLDAFRVARSLAQQVAQGAVSEYAALLPPLLCPHEGQRVVLLAGFGVLSGTEDAILRHVWQAGGHVCLHTDIAVLNKKGHWACADHQQWLARWGAEALVAVPPAGLAGPRVHFMAGYDAHSQLLAVRNMLDADGSGGPNTKALSTAIVLADSSLLMPTLHTLPEKGVNISMGYPLERTPLCRLVDNVLQAHATRQEDGRYHWRSLRHCLRHPYLQMLSMTGECGDTAEAPFSLRPVLLRMEGLLREGSRFVRPEDLSVQALGALGVGLDSPVAVLTQRVLACILDNFAAVRTPEDMGQALTDLCGVLVDYGEHLWEHYPLDAESLYRLMHDVVPTLQGSALAQTVFPLPALHSLVRQAIQAGRVPFEADPIAGMQVLGMLETRLLHFDRVIIVDATDDNVPGSPAQDPLLPDSLRLIVGLPDVRHRDRTTAYNLFRLLQSAQEVYFYWQEGVQRSALFDGKKSRSRFVDALIWQEEQQRGVVLQAGEEPLELSPCPVHPMARARTPLRNSPALRARMAEILAQGLSPTKLDAYMTCPLRFAFEHVCRITPVREVNEGDDPAAVGALIHKVLQQVYTPYVHKDIQAGDIDADTLRQTFLTLLEASDLRTKLPPDSYCMLELAGPLRLGRYLERQPAASHIVALEHRFSASLESDNSSYTVHGTVDRVDKRQGALVVLDYKTGEVHAPAPSLWSDTEFWQSLNCYFAGQEGSLAGTSEAVSDPLLTLKERIGSVQLPCYIYLLNQSDVLRGHGPVGDAALVRLRDDGEEIMLFGDALDAAAQRMAVEDCIPTLLRFLLQHMEFTDSFVPISGAHCQWCEYEGMCLK
ncbi:MAG: PD-(D/E)XK nuclease family protein [Desulfovibrionaceae bacterium]